MSTVPLYLDLLGKPLDGSCKTLRRLGQWETKMLTYDIENLTIRQPVFITGLARAGSTLLLEILAAHGQTASYQYRDYPFVHTPYFWQTIRKFIPASRQKVERTHRDKMMVNAYSPEAMDEILWQSFFSSLHNPTYTNILSQKNYNESFNRFYRNNILKILFARQGSRFVTKNNYAFTRLDYLKNLFPDIRIIIPLRRAESHIYSMVKQNRLFRAVQQNDPRARRYAKRLGHFEFGLDFKPVNTGDHKTVKTIKDLWSEDRFTEAYTHYWAMIYRYLWDHVVNAPTLAGHITLVRYDELCRSPDKSIKNILSFCDLADDENTLAWPQRISPPDYYKATFSNSEKQLIKDITGETERLFWPEDD